MTEMILIKQHNSHEVAHLYEHLFCRAVDDFFYDHELFPYLDYELTGLAFRDIIYAHVTLKTKEAKQLADELTRLTVPLDDIPFHTALVQIFAEKEHHLGVAGDDTPDWEAVRKELREIDKRPWRHIDDIDIVTPLEVQMVPGSLYVPLEKKSEPARRVRVTFTLDQAFADEHQELLPLFWKLAMLMSENTTTSLCATFGFYSRGLVRRPKRQATKLIHRFHIPPMYPLELPKVRESIRSTLLDMHDSKAFKRFVAELCLASHADPDRILPGPHYIYERTRILVGAKGWQRLATDENCNLILSHMKVTVSAGRQRASTKVGSILDL